MNKKIKYCIISVVAIIIILLLVLIYKNVFASSNSSRYNGIENHVLSNDEKNSAKIKINELENVKDIDIHVDSKIIKIIVTLTDDIDFEKVKSKADEVVSSFKEKNLSYYDIEFYVDSKNEESEVYPQIGYKFKTNEKFSW